MGKVIAIRAERWTTVYRDTDKSSSMSVQVSTMGSVKFTIFEQPTNMHDRMPTASMTLPMSKAMEMFKALGIAFGSEDVSGKDS